jgi:epoxyqueuosine reductase QueG
VKIENKRVVWGGDCEQCMACIQWCPQQAINYADKTKTRKRYHHPKIKFADMAGK